MLREKIDLTRRTILNALYYICRIPFWMLSVNCIVGINIYYQIMQHIAECLWERVEKLLGMHGRYVDPLPLCHSTRFCMLRCLEIKKHHLVEVARCLTESLELLDWNIDYDTHLDSEIHDDLFLHVGCVNRASLTFFIGMVLKKVCSIDDPNHRHKKEYKVNVTTVSVETDNM